MLCQRNHEYNTVLKHPSNVMRMSVSAGVVRVQVSASVGECRCVRVQVSASEGECMVHVSASASERECMRVQV